jgi:hypothetical protein
VHLLPYFDLVIVLDDGQVRAAGTYDELKRSGIDIDKLVPEVKVEEVATEGFQEDYLDSQDDNTATVMHEADRTDASAASGEVGALATVVDDESGDNNVAVPKSAVSTGVVVDKRGRTRTGSNITESESSKVLHAKARTAAEERRADNRESTITTKETRKYGSVSLETYRYYIKAGGYQLMAIAILFMLAGQVFTVLGELGMWSSIYARDFIGLLFFRLVLVAGLGHCHY